jgi:hypothetical protein
MNKTNELIENVALENCAEAVTKAAAGIEDANAGVVSAEVLERLQQWANNVSLTEYRRLEAIDESGEEYNSDRYEYASRYAASLILLDVMEKITPEKVKNAAISKSPWLFGYPPADHDYEAAK